MAGSGKTLAFLVPLFAILEQNRKRDEGPKQRRLAGVQAVIVAPTRELAMQITKVEHRVKHQRMSGHMPARM